MGDGVLRREGPDRLGKPLLPGAGHMDLEVSFRAVLRETPHMPAVHCSLAALDAAVVRGQKKIPFLLLYFLHELTTRGSEIIPDWRCAEPCMLQGE